VTTTVTHFSWRERILTPFVSPVTDVTYKLEVLAAVQAIELKRQELGGLPGPPQGEMEPVTSSGWRRRFAGADIYYSEATGAHEVHGEIRNKYDALGGVNSGLGLPVTDERGTPDGVGRFNHFERGSIYWTPSTGPMAVRGEVRDAWAAQGWELGGLGYPVADHHVKVFANPGAQPVTAWTVFQGGAMFSRGPLTAPALQAHLGPDLLRHVVRGVLDRDLKAADDNLGIEGGISIARVSNWGHGFWASRKRLVTFGVHGFRSVDVFPDPTFYLELTFEFGLTWPMSFTEPMDKTITLRLHQLYVHTSGVGHGALHDGLKDGILKKFKEPLAFRTIPATVLLIDMLVTPAGGLQFLVEPSLPNPLEGELRRNALQIGLDRLSEE
jgi:hypothetical protein